MRFRARPLSFSSLGGTIDPMTLEPAPQSVAAERNRAAAARARAYRQRAREAQVVDTAIVEALAAALGRVRKGLAIETFIVDLATDAAARMRLAGVERPMHAFRDRIDPSASAGSAPEAT